MWTLPLSKIEIRMTGHRYPLSLPMHDSPLEVIVKFTRLAIPSFLCLFVISSALWAQAGRSKAQSNQPFLEWELLFPPERIHNHSSSLVELPNGDLLVCWYRGSGERTANDVAVMGARKPKGQKAWSKSFLMADTPGYPDTNPILFLDPQKKLWLIYSTILNNQWESALLKYKTSTDYQGKGCPRWDSGDVIHVTPGLEFTSAVEKSIDSLPKDNLSKRLQAELERVRKGAGDKLTMRLGWMPRVHLLILNPQKWILPLYSDGFNYSLMAITADAGLTWQASLPIIGMGNVQPSLVRKKDGTIAAFMRDNGSAPKRVPYSESHDEGQSWSEVHDLPIPNPGASIEVIALKNGHWVMANNDLEKDRYRLAISLSQDEGATWPWTRYVDRDPSPQEDSQAYRGSYHYPSLIQASDGFIHLTYSYYPKEGQAIKHACFNESWIRAGTN